MIKVDIKSDVLKETKKNKMELGIHAIVNIEGSAAILEVELYKLLKEFEKQIPEVWANALERVVDDARMDDYLEGEDEE